MPSTLPNAAPISRFRLTCLMRISKMTTADAGQHADQRGYRASRSNGRRNKAAQAKDGNE